MVDFKNKVATLSKLGRIEFDDEKGHFTFSPKRGLHKVFDLKVGWVRTNTNLVILVENEFNKLTSVSA